MPTSISAITLIAGLALILVGLVGGGIQAKEITIPPLPLVPRATSFLVGCILISLVLLDPQQSPPTPDKPREYGGAIPRLLTVRDSERILQHLGFYDGPLTDVPDDRYFLAVANSQHSKNITQDGLVGGETYGKFREEWPEYFENRQLGKSN